MSHQDDIKAIVTSVGGAANIKSLTHCATRLRFELNDAGKVDNAALDANKLVLGAVPQSGDRYQVVIGGQVASVYEQIMHLPEMAGLGAGTVDDDADEPTDAEVKAAARSKARGKVAWLDSFFEYLADSFRPILGVLLGASIIIALVNLCISLGLIPNDTATTGLVFVQAIWKGVFYFLPIMVAYNAAKKLKVDPWLGGAIMGMLMTPQFASLSDTKTWGDAVKCVKNTTLGTSSCTATVFGLPMQLSDYSGNVFVPLLMVAVLAVVYHGLKKIIPDSVQMVFLPFFSMIIVGALTAFIIGPIGVWAGNGLGAGLAWMNTHAPFIFAIAIPLLYPFLVPLGLHWPLNALMIMNINTLGYDFIQGPMGVWNFACFGATAGVLFLAVRDKDKDMRQTALGALAAGLLGGVSEPSLYGIHLRYKLIYKRMLVGCGLGGVVIAILGWLFPSVTAAGQTVHGVTTTAFAFTSLLTIPVFNQMWVYAVSIAVSFLTSFLLIITFDYRTPEQKAEVLARAAANQKTAVSSVEAKGVAPAAATATATVAATKTEAPAAAATTTVVNAPVAGHVISLDETGDPVFASRALGEGVGIQPADSTVVAPVSGVLQTVAETGHAFGIKTDDGVEVLVHVGIDTVKMNGEGFDVKVKANEHVNAGDNLVVVDFDKVKEAGYSTTTLMTVLNTVAFASVTPKTGVDVKAGESVIDIQR